MPKHATINTRLAEPKHLPPILVTYVTVWGEWFPPTHVPAVVAFLKEHDIDAKGLGNTVKVAWSARVDVVQHARDLIHEWRVTQ